MCIFESCGRRRWIELRGKSEGGEFGLVHALLDECTDLQAPFDAKDVLQPGSGARMQGHEEFAAVLIRFDGGGEASDLLGLFGNFNLIHSDQGAKHRQFGRLFHHR